MKKSIEFEEFVNSRDESLINEVIEKLLPGSIIDWRDHYSVDVYTDGDYP